MAFTAGEILEEFCEKAHFSREVHVRRTAYSHEGYLWSLLLKKRERERLYMAWWRKKPGSKAKISESMKMYYAKPGIRDRILAYNKTRYQDHAYRTAQLARAASWAKKNKALINERNRAKTVAAGLVSGKLRLMEETKATIRAELAKGVPTKEIVEKMGFSRSTVERIKRGRR
jgi:hypothetical protein